VTEAKQVLNKADVALYRSKNTGRNRVSYYENLMEASQACA
jgi:PleD family two-component response regulator